MILSSSVIIIPRVLMIPHSFCMLSMGIYKQIKYKHTLLWKPCLSCKLHFFKEAHCIDQPLPEHMNQAHRCLSPKCEAMSWLLQHVDMLNSSKQSHREYWQMPCWRKLGRKPWLNETYEIAIIFQSVSAHFNILPIYYVWQFALSCP